MSSERLAVVRVGTTPPEVVTFVRVDTAAAPDGFALVLESSLPPNWVPSPHDQQAVPETVTRWQFRRWLVDHGIFPESVEAMIEASIADPLDRARALVDWRDGPIVRRDHPLLGPMAAALGLTEAAVDAAFREAAEYR
jgi:hypothetical protein